MQSTATPELRHLGEATHSLVSKLRGSKDGASTPVPIGQKPDVTIFSDASILPKSFGCGIGFWMKGDNRPSFSKAVPMTVFVKNIVTMELIGLRAALFFGLQAQYFRSEDRLIMLQCDNTVALSLLASAVSTFEIRNHTNGAEIHKNCKLKSLHKYQDHIKAICSLVDHIGGTVVLRHVRGHQPGSKRQWVNRHCDAMAKQAAKQSIEVIERKKCVGN